MITKKQVCVKSYHSHQYDLYCRQIRKIQDYFSMARLVESTHYYAKSSVLSSNYLPLACALKLAKNDNYLVRAGLALYSKHRQVLEALVYDSDSMVGRQAEQSLKRLKLL